MDAFGSKVVVVRLAVWEGWSFFLFPRSSEQARSAGDDIHQGDASAYLNTAVDAFGSKGGKTQLRIELLLLDGSLDPCCIASDQSKQGATSPVCRNI